MKLPTIVKTQYGIVIEIRELKISSKQIKGMRDGKIFVDFDRYFINMQAQTYEIVEMEALNGDQVLPLSEITFDTNKRVSCIVQHEQKVLLIYREKNGRKYYTFVGGHIQQGENPIETVVREVKEETNLDISNPTKLIEFDNGEYGYDIAFHAVINTIPANLFSSNPEVEETETAEIIWLNIDEAIKLPNLFPPQISKLLENL
jgi:8-oxo-dGTP pyrophosphatase MutT (NUDIX family)